LNAAIAQDFRITGVLLNADDQLPLVGATVKLTSARDTTQFKYTTSKQQGDFEFSKLNRGPYILEITYIGFDKLRKSVVANSATPKSEQYILKPSATTLKEVDVTSTTIRGEQKGDTVQFNANAFKVTQDATTEDLVRKMPGITVENGTVKAHGEEVKKVLVDGKQFFGDDPSVALRNLPAEVVDKIQVFDKLSDQAAWTGFDDGNAQKTLNIVTKSAKNNGQFGKFSAGYGTNDRYLLGANMNIFNDQRRITLLGLSNNINMQNFTADEATSGSSGSGGGMMSGRGGGPGGGFNMGPSSGINTINSLGGNFNQSWGTKLTVNGSYFYNRNINDLTKKISRQYFLTADSSQYYNENTVSRNTGNNHRMNVRIEYNPNDNNSIIFTPRLTVQNSSANSNVLALSGYAPDFLTTSMMLSATDNQTESKSESVNFNNDFLYRHKFAKKGRTASINLGTGFNDRTRDNVLSALNSYYGTQSGTWGDSLQQQAKTLTTGLSLSSNLVYTEPVGENSQLQANYNISYSKNDNDKKTFDYVFEQQDYSPYVDTLLSNVYNNRYITHRPGLGYLYKTEKANLNAGVTYQYALLKGEQEFPKAANTENTFKNILPNLFFNYKFSDRMNLRVVYRSSTNAPSVSQLQEVVDNSNQLLLSAGNPNLKQEVRHFAMSRFSWQNKPKTANIFWMFFFQKMQDYIGNSTMLVKRDTVFFGQFVARGAQISMPVNLDDSWNTRTFLSVGIPLKFIKSNLNFNSGLSYTQIPSLINGMQNLSKTLGINEGAVIASNISQKLDFTLTYNFNYNFVDNTLQSQSDNNYIYQAASATVNWQFWKGFFVQNNVTYQKYNGISTSYLTDYTLWNAAVGMKFLKNNAAEVKLSAFDLLNENRSVNRSVSDTYIEDSYTEVLQRYVMLTFTYNLRNFNGKTPPANPDRRGDWHRDGPPPGGGSGPPPGGGFSPPPGGGFPL
ncbi:MAG TPA: TonB-dependent receptor, partial [Bacteroidales bacterium]|nr:TonB-dependent receptor [Bacteroidales bacterium]